MQAELSAFDLILGAETRAARIGAALDADPGLGQQWRAEAGLAEAVASVGLEDVRLAETDLLNRIFGNGGDAVEVRAAEDALGILRFIRSPGWREESGVSLIRRIGAIARAGVADKSEQATEEELAAVFTECRGRSPILEACRASGRYARLTGRQNPVAERMVFMAAEHLSRSAGGADRPRAEDPYRGLGGRYDAEWIALPAMALTYRRFRIWSPVNPAHLRALLEGMDQQLGRELGRLAEIRKWLAAGRAAGEGAHGRSRLADLIAAFTTEPVMGATRVADRIGITARGALNLLARLTDDGLLVEMTRRRSARIWSTPGLARLLVSAAPVQRMPATRRAGGSRGEMIETVAAPPAREERPVDPAGVRRFREEQEASMAAAMSEFDRIMGEADDILARIQSNRPG